MLDERKSTHWTTREFKLTKVSSVALSGEDIKGFAGNVEASLFMATRYWLGQGLHFPVLTSAVLLEVPVSRASDPHFSFLQSLYMLTTCGSPGSKFCKI